MSGIAVEEFVGLEPKVCSILVSNSSEYKEGKAANKNVAAKISHNEYKDVLLNKKYLRHLVNKKVKIIKSTIFFCLALLINFFFLIIFYSWFFILDNTLALGV